VPARQSYLKGGEFWQVTAFDSDFETAKNQVVRNQKHDERRNKMEEAKNDQNTGTLTVKTRKRRWLDGFVKFLMYGGFMLIIIGGFIIYVVISILIK
jgi:type IV secretory pathway VirB6-like protein